MFMIIPSPLSSNTILIPEQCECMLSHVQLFATPRTAAHQAPLSIGFFRQDYWSGLPFLTSGHLPDPGVKAHVSWVSCIGRLMTTAPPGKPHEQGKYLPITNISNSQLLSLVSLALFHLYMSGHKYIATIIILNRLFYQFYQLRIVKIT